MIQAANKRMIDLGPEAIASVDPFGAIGTKPTNGKASAKTYPLLPDRDAGGLVDSLYDAQQRKKSAEASEKAIKLDLGLRARIFHRGISSGKAGEPPSSIEVKSESGRACKVSLKNFYPKVNADDQDKIGGLLSVFGDEETLFNFMRRRTDLKISIDKIPDDRMGGIAKILVKIFSASTEELNEMHDVLEMFTPQGPGCLDAIDRSTILVPNEGFHAIRHRELSMSQNTQLDDVLPCTVSVGQVK